VNTKKESILLFFGLVFALSIPIWVLGEIKPVEFLPGIPISSLGAFTPALAALILKYRDDRLAGFFQLLGRSFDFRRVQDKIWYLAFILINPAVAVLAYGALRISGKALPSPSLTIGIIPLFLVFFIAALGEEIGWTGYATEPLLRRWGGLSAGIWLGLVWAVWHFIPLVQAHRSAEWIAWWSLGTIALRVIMVWLYVNAGKSVFAAALFHAMINLCWQLFPVNGSYYDPRVFSLITLGFAVAFLAGQRILRGKVRPA
jgi:membrane protease YdiL (CAAX protease family)